MKLTINQNKTIEEYWENIAQLKRELKFREWELSENNYVDENQGGGRSSKISDPTARKAFVLLNDEKYQNLQKTLSAIDYVINKVNNDSKQRLLKEFMDLKYISKDSRYTDWDDVAMELDIKTRKCYHLRSKLIDMTAERLGWL